MVRVIRRSSGLRKARGIILKGNRCKVKGRGVLAVPLARHGHVIRAGKKNYPD